MKLSRKDKETLDNALYEAWASIGSVCLEYGGASDNNPSTPMEEQIEKIIDRLFQSLDPDLCLYVLHMSEEEFSEIIQSYVDEGRYTSLGATNAQGLSSLLTQVFKKAV